MSAPVLIARFRSEADLTQAAACFKQERLGPFRIVSAHPVAVADDCPPAWVPVIALIAGLAGFAASLALQIYADASDYVLDIGGRPPNSWPAYIPTAFENGILCVVLASFAAFVALALALDDLGDCIAANVETTMLDSYYLAVRPVDEIGVERAHGLLRAAHAEQTIEVPQ